MGTSAASVVFIVTHKDHPHACGDKRSPTSFFVLQKGSSPRVWGQAVSTYTTENDSRIIPTRVGTSIKSPLGALYTEDHPHACGDKIYQTLLILEQKGSSPRVWGQGRSTEGIKHGIRIIPTRVGTSNGNGSCN